MSAPLRLRYEGNGDFRVMSNYHAARADKDYVVGEVYTFDEFQDRSDVSHNHEFAFVAEAWKTIHERYNEQPWAHSPEHLRKYALIKTKFCNTLTYPCGSRAEAERWATNMRRVDEYSIVMAEGSVVYRFTAMSQKRRGIGALDKATFQRSKQAIMDFLDDLLEVKRGSTADARAA